MTKIAKNDILNVAGAKLFNRSNDGDLVPMFVYIRPREIRFSMKTVQRINLKPGNYIELVQLDGKNWFFAITNNDKAYKVGKDSSRAGYRCTASVVARSIVTALNPGKDRVDCMLEETNFELKGRPVYKIVKRPELGK